MCPRPKQPRLGARRALAPARVRTSSWCSSKNALEPVGVCSVDATQREAPVEPCSLTPISKDARTSPWGLASTANAGGDVWQVPCVRPRASEWRKSPARRIPLHGDPPTDTTIGVRRHSDRVVVRLEVVIGRETIGHRDSVAVHSFTFPSTGKSHTLRSPPISAAISRRHVGGRRQRPTRNPTDSDQARSQRPEPSRRGATPASHRPDQP